MRKLTRAEVATLKLAASLDGTIRVFPDQNLMISRLEILGLMRGNGVFFGRESTITEAGRKALAGGSDGR